MSNILEDAFYSLYINSLIISSPATLFHKINRLPWYQNMLRNWADGLDLKPNQRLLEVGSATGVLSQYLSSKGLYVCGADASSAMLKKAVTTKIESVNYLQVRLPALPCKQEVFDLVIGASIINIVTKPGLCTREMAKVCKAGGKVSLLIPKAGFGKKGVARLATEMNLTGFSKAALGKWNSAAPKMKVAKLHDYMESAGLREIDRVDYLDGMVTAVTGSKV